MNLAAVERRFEALKPWQVFAAIFLIGFCVRAAGVLATGQYRNLERFELERVAISLAQGGVFGNPYAIPTGPTAHVSPGYPLILAAIFRFCGTGVSGEIVKQLVACISSALVCACVPIAARALQISSVAAVGAALFAAILPIKLRTETEGDWESTYAALGLLVVISLTTAAWRSSSFGASIAIWIGIAWGVTLLFVSAFLPLLPALLLVGLAMAPARARARYLRHAVIALLVTSVCLAPWVLRNWLALGKPIVGRDNGGIELRVSNNPYAVASAEQNYVNGVYHRYHPYQSSAEASKVLQMGELAFNRMAMDEAFAWIRQNPGQFARLTLSRARWYWFFGDWRYLPRATVLGLYTLLAFAGVYRLYRKNKLSFAAVTTVLLIVPLPNYLVHVGPKHRYPIDWLLVLLAAFAIEEWCRTRRLNRPIL